ncbi:MAG: hypothetical protein H8E66_25230 [Planctomycetes bacterium]|nr:hypothetical protein [Planctomycetota bacterium]
MSRQPSRRQFMKSTAVAGTFVFAAEGVHAQERNWERGGLPAPGKPDRGTINQRHDVLFAFDDVGFEMVRGVRLEMVRPDKHADNPILERGKAGEPDAMRVAFPSIIRDGGRWRIWYAAVYDNWMTSRVGYAESDDGIVWRKPELGLCEHKGSTQNNLVKSIRGLSTVAVIRDEEAPPERRYVMAGTDMSWFKKWARDAQPMTRIDVSPDGLNWTPVRDKPGIVPGVDEMICLYKFRGNYHIAAHQSPPILHLPMQEDIPNLMFTPRTFVVWRSPTIDRWPDGNTIAFFKPMRSSSPYVDGWDGEQVHLGASVLPYRNVCVGAYGQWHYPQHRDKNGKWVYDDHLVSADLGLVVSNDGMHFREPAPGFTMIARDEELRWDRDHKDNKDDDKILLVQGPIINTDVRTHLYYTASTPGGNTGKPTANMGLATWPRDRFGYLSAIDETRTAKVTSCPLEYDDDVRLYANADVPAGSSLQISLMDEHGLDVLPGYGAAEGGQVKESGLDVAVDWKEQPLLPGGRPFRIRCEIKGKTRVFALYLRSAK